MDTQPEDRGRLSFVESISVLDRDPRELGHEDAIVFYSTSETPRWRRAEELVDTTSGVVCAPTNFQAAKPPAEPVLRVTALANHDLWCALPEEEYRRQKEIARDAVIEAAHRQGVAACAAVDAERDSAVDLDAAWRKDPGDRGRGGDRID